MSWRSHAKLKQQIPLKTGEGVMRNETVNLPRPYVNLCEPNLTDSIVSTLQMKIVHKKDLETDHYVPHQQFSKTP